MLETATGGVTEQGRALAARMERFVRDVIIPYEADPRRDGHGPTDALVQEMRGLAREHGISWPMAAISAIRIRRWCCGHPGCRFWVRWR
jgi:hypothetical protein